MSDSYKAFIRDLKRQLIEQNLTAQNIAERMNVGQATVYNWLSFRTVMSAEHMIQIVETVMGGRYEKIGMAK